MKMLISMDELEALSCRALVTCECEICHKPFLVAKNVALRGIKGTKAIKYCSRECKRLGMSKPTITRICIGCKKEFSTKSNVQQWCSRNCARDYHNQIRAEQGTKRNRTCLFCGQAIRSWGSIFCSKTCAHRLKAKKSLSLWKNGQHSGSTPSGEMAAYVTTYILEKFQNQCFQCGWKEVHPITKTSPLHIHHKDGDSTHNNEENLVLLCPNCHALTENFGRLNKNGARRRRRLHN